MRRKVSMGGTVWVEKNLVTGDSSMVGATTIFFFFVFFVFGFFGLMFGCFFFQKKKTFDQKKQTVFF